MTSPRLELGEFIDSGEADLQTGPFGTQLKASEYVDHGVPVINVRNIGYGDLRPEQVEYVSQEKSERLSAHILRTSDIVFGRKGAVDRHLLVSEGEDGWVQGSDCIRLRLESKRLDARYLSYALLSPTHRTWMLTQSANKATMASLNHDVIRRIKVAVPDSDVQKACVDVLSLFDRLIENNRRRIKLLEESARLIYREWFVRLRFPGYEHTKIENGVPEGWTRLPITEVIDFNPRERLSDGPVTFLPMGALSETGMTVDASQIEKRGAGTTVKFRNMDTLLARITPCLENGKTAFVGFLGEDEVASGSTEFIVMRAKNVGPCFTYCLARSEDFRGIAIASMIGSSGRQRVQVDAFREFLCLQPTESLLEEFEEVARPKFDLIWNLVKANERLKAGRDLLLPRLMSGEIAI